MGPHCSAPALFVTRMRSLTTSTILPAPAAALGSGGGVVQLSQLPSATPSNEQGNAAMSQGRIRDICGDASAVEACLRVPELGRDGNAGWRPRLISTRPASVGAVLASADLAASAKFVRPALPLPLFLFAWQPPMSIEIRTSIRHSRWRISTPLIGNAAAGGHSTPAPLSERELVASSGKQVAGRGSGEQKVGSRLRLQKILSAGRAGFGVLVSRGRRGARSLREVTERRRLASRETERSEGTRRGRGPLAEPRAVGVRQVPSK